LKLVSVPTAVIQIARDQVVAPDSATGIASEISGSEFVSIDSSNHILLENEPGWQEFKAIFARHIPGGPAPAPTRAAIDPRVLEELSKREQQIFSALAKGLNNQQIADSLFISDKTVRNHITSIFDKLGVSSRAQAIVLAKESGL
jgi:DNA-binding NarL/FixJ family response regulator